MEKNDSTPVSKRQKGRWVAGLVVSIILIGIAIYSANFGGTKWDRMGVWSRSEWMSVYRIYGLERPEWDYAEIEKKVHATGKTWEELGLNKDKLDRCRKQAHLGNAEQIIKRIPAAITRADYSRLDQLFYEAIKKAEVSDEKAADLRRRYQPARAQAENLLAQGERLAKEAAILQVKEKAGSFCKSE